MVLKWVGVALLVVACLLAVYLGATLLGELAVLATYPWSSSIPAEGGAGLGRTTPERLGTVLVGRVRTVGDAVRLGVMFAQNLVKEAT